MGGFTTKKSKKIKTPPKKKHEPRNFEEYMEEAIHLEEQGERYQSGEKSRKYYEKAAEMYCKAFELNEKDADCVYNWGRVLFLLVEFLPTATGIENRIKILDQSIEKFRLALNLEPKKIDAQFNLGQALHQRSEILNETEEIENAYELSAVALQESMSIFDQLYSLQENEYAELHKSQVNTETSDEDERISENLAEKSLTSQQQKEFTTATKLETTTEYSLIETLLSTSETMSTMGSMVASFTASMDLFSKAKAKLVLAEQWYEKMPCETSNEIHEKKIARIQINLKEAMTYSLLADRTFVASNIADSRLYNKAIGCLDEIIQNDPGNIEALCDKGDILLSYGKALVEIAEKKKLSLKPNEKEIWNILSSATKSFQDALTIETKNLKILNKMGDLSLIRAQLELSIAERNRLQLLKNAQFYYKQAVEVDREILTSGYIGWAMSEWAIEEWSGVAGKKQDALKVINAWVKRGGDELLFHRIVEDNDAWVEEFVEFVVEAFFNQK